MLLLLFGTDTHTATTTVIVRSAVPTVTQGTATVGRAGG